QVEIFSVTLAPMRLGFVVQFVDQGGVWHLFFDGKKLERLQALTRRPLENVRVESVLHIVSVIRHRSAKRDWSGVLCFFDVEYATVISQQVESCAAQYPCLGVFRKRGQFAVADGFEIGAGFRLAV